VRTLVIIAGVLIAAGAVIAVVATFAVRALRKYVRALWPHS
jgi:hypothetical protein